MTSDREIAANIEIVPDRGRARGIGGIPGEAAAEVRHR
jgi:hypothetical protein